jgi:hypothetical protein
VAACLVLGVGIGVAIRQWRPTAAPRSSSGPAHPLPDAPGDPLPRALAQADSADEKSRWVDDLPEVDLASLDGARRTIFLRLANTRRCTCGCGYTLAACRIYDATCDKSLPKVVALFDSVAGGLIADADGARVRPATDTK